MSRKITQEIFLQRFYQRFPDARIKVLKYDSLKKECVLKCVACGKIYKKPSAQGFLSSWNCCGGHNETKIEMIKRLCEEDGRYQFIKQIDSLHVLIKHLDCGNELVKKVQSATGSPCSCSYCATQSQKLRLTKEQAQKRLDDAFNGQIELLFFDGVDSRKSQFRCLKCGLIFNQQLENFVSKCRGCPKCDQRRSRGEKTMRKFLDGHNIIYKEQYRIPELGKLSFDFAVFDKGRLIGLIEVQGEQHYREVFRYASRPNAFKKQQEHDNQKRQYCKEHNIPLYEIINMSGVLKNLDILNELLSSTTIPAKGSTS